MSHQRAPLPGARPGAGGVLGEVVDKRWSCWEPPSILRSQLSFLVLLSKCLLTLHSLQTPDLSIYLPRSPFQALPSLWIQRKNCACCYLRPAAALVHRITCSLFLQLTPFMPASLIIFPFWQTIPPRYKYSTFSQLNTHTHTHTHDFLCNYPILSSPHCTLLHLILSRSSVSSMLLNPSG